MPGPNTTGKPNTEDYNLGRGIVHVAELTNGIAGAYRDLGNAPEFNISIEVEKVEHQTSRTGLRTVDKEVVISQKVSLSLTIDELNHENVALFFSGSKNARVNPAVAGFAEHELTDSAEVGRWYDITTSTNLKAFDVLASDLTIQARDNGTSSGDASENDLVEGTDYDLDAKAGMIFLRTDSSLVGDTDAIDITLAANGSATATINEVRALTSSAVTVALKFISINPASSDARTEYQFWSVALTAEGDFQLISDEFTSLQLTGAAEKNETASPNSPTLTISEIPA